MFKYIILLITLCHSNVIHYHYYNQDKGSSIDITP